MGSGTATGHAAPLHHDLFDSPLRFAFSKASSLSGGRNLPLRRLGGTTASIASSFSVGSARTYDSVVVRLLCPNPRDTLRMSFLSCSTLIAPALPSALG